MGKNKRCCKYRRKRDFRDDKEQHLFAQEKYRDGERKPGQEDYRSGEAVRSIGTGKERDRHDACFAVASFVFEVFVNLTCCCKQECKADCGNDAVGDAFGERV